MATNFHFNVLSTAQRVIRTQDFVLRRYNGRVKMPNGVYVSNYDDDVTLNGSIQPIARSRYEKMGLDFEKDYISILATTDIMDLMRDRSGDQIVIDGRLFETIGESDWTRSAGWNRIMCVRVGTV